MQQTYLFFSFTTFSAIWVTIFINVLVDTHIARWKIRILIFLVFMFIFSDNLIVVTNIFHWVLICLSKIFIILVLLISS